MKVSVSINRAGEQKSVAGSFVHHNPRNSVSVITTVAYSSISFEGQDASDSETGSPWWGHDEVKIDSEEWSPALYCVD